MFYVYIIISASKPNELYVGCTSDLKQRLIDHNNGKSPHTAKFIPWDLQTYTAFSDKQVAYDFEKYLKSHSGRAFLKKRLLRAPPGTPG